MARCDPDRARLPLKPRSINRQVVSVRDFLRYLAHHGLIAGFLVNGLAYVKEPHLLPTSVLTHTQVKDLFGRIETDHAERLSRPRHAGTALLLGPESRRTLGPERR